MLSKTCELKPNNFSNTKFNHIKEELIFFVSSTLKGYKYYAAL